MTHGTDYLFLPRFFPTLHIFIGDGYENSKAALPAAFAGYRGRIVIILLFHTSPESNSS
jgi:hypothetical protein